MSARLTERKIGPLESVMHFEQSIATYQLPVPLQQRSGLKRSTP